MGERSDQITRKIELTRGELGENLQELEHKMKDATDWRKQFQKSPLTMIGIAFGGGVLLSRVMGGSSRPHRHYRSRDNGEDRRSPAADAGTKYEIKKVAGTWDNIKGALIGVAASKAKRISWETLCQDFTRNIRRSSTIRGHKPDGKCRSHPQQLSRKAFDG